MQKAAKLNSTVIVSRSQVLIVGAGITGLAIARELLSRGYRDIVLLEKESDLGAHASGRNSGVLHAGIYYTTGSLKAKFCIEGNRLMKAFCREHGLTLVENGKVIVARNAAELPQLEELKRRAQLSGASVEMVNVSQLAQIEPFATTHELALFSPETAVIDARQILHTLARELLESGRVKIFNGTTFEGLNGNGSVRTNRGGFGFELFVNAAGAFADRVAWAFGVGDDYRFLPFKGTYKELAPSRSQLCRGSIYPVPDLRNPFLGVHFTHGADGVVTIGPTAIPAWGRENYRWARGMTAEAVTIALRELRLLAINPAFRSAATTEPRMYSKHLVYRRGRQLIPELRPSDIKRSARIGIRPQLVNRRTGALEMDFVVAQDACTIHVLNAISPAFTSSLAFARYLVDRWQDS